MQAGFFVKDLDLGLFDPFKDIRRVSYLMRWRLMQRKRLLMKGRVLRSKAMMPVCMMPLSLSFFFFVGIWPHKPCVSRLI